MEVPTLGCTRRWVPGPALWLSLSLAWLCVALHPSACIVAAADASFASGVDKTIEDNINALISWVEDDGYGYFNPSQEIRPAGTNMYNDESTFGLGVFAKEDIHPGTVLARISFDKAIHDPKDEALADDDEAEWKRKSNPNIEVDTLPCNGIKQVMAEIRLGDASKFAPFFKYLKSIPAPFIPSAWTPEGRDFFQRMTTGTTIFTMLPPFEPVHWIEKDWRQNCDGGTSDEEIWSLLSFITRSDTDVLVPVYDLYNHHDGKQRNAKVSILNEEDDDIDYRYNPNTSDKRKPDDYEVYASKFIAKGEQIFVTYVDCPHCERGDYYGTPELLRDYGFIEDYPQQWAFFYDDFRRMRAILDIDIDPTSISDSDDKSKAPKYTVDWNGDDVRIGRDFLKIYLRRLGRLRSDEIALGREAWAVARNTTTVIPQREWDVVKSYVDAAIIVLSNAFDSLTDDKKLPKDKDLYYCMTEVNDMCMVHQLYHPLNAENDMPYGRDFSCDIVSLLDFSKGHTTLDTIHTEYQTIWYYKRFPEGKDDEAELTQEDMEQETDICMKLDEEVQICDSYRPHYHEYAINYAARYLKEVKRVAFIGGGDNMILQEFLKYPDLELVVALELDQIVVRNSFKWFHTEPSFHDDRVEWWFGDATKSLLLLPKEYMNSFDLVMVDVSETGASLTVTRHLDILNAMALLVKPDGIMVKNEPYFRQLSRAFDYSVDIHFYDCPMICEQSMIMGSNEIDFYHVDDMVDHGVENLLLPALKDYPHQYPLWRDYKINDGTKDKSCKKLERAIAAQQKTDGVRSGKSEGVVMIVDVENCSLPMEKVEDAIVETLQSLQSLQYTSIVSEHNAETSFEVVVLMAEGYVIARRWAEEKYVALDIHLWGRFERMDATRAALVKALGSGNDIKEGSVSSFRVVASGMYGNDSWEEDDKLIGPDLTTHTRDCDKDSTKMAPSPTAAERNLDTVEGIFTEELVSTGVNSIVDDMFVEGSIALVFCGLSGEQCHAKKALEENPNVGHVVPLYICSDIADAKFGEPTNGKKLHKCRREVESQIKEIVRETGIAIDAAFLDGDAPYAMARIFSSFFTFRRSIFQDTVIHTLVSIMPDSRAETWRLNVIVDTRRKLDMDPLTRSEVIVKPKGSTRDASGVKFNILNVDMETTFPKVRNVEKALLARYGEDLEIFPTVLEGGGLIYQNETEFQPIEFKQSDYDLSAGIKQYEEQKALGRQSIYQLGRDDGHRDSSPNMDTILLAVQESMGYTLESSMLHNDLGDGAVAIVRWKEAHVVGIWDGRDHITLNLFQFDQTRSVSDLFMGRFLAMAGTIWGKQLRDDFPRGVNKVINFSTEHK